MAASVTLVSLAPRVLVDNIDWRSKMTREDDLIAAAKAVLLARARELVVLKDPSLKDASNAEIIEAARLILLGTTEGLKAEDVSLRSPRQREKDRQ
jgi:hypothetical protein